MIRLICTCLATGLILALASTGGEAAPEPVEDQVETIIVTSVPRSFLKAAWTQYGPQGVLEVRAVVSGDFCPALWVDLQRVAMHRRAAADGDFPSVCAAVLPAGTKQAALVFVELIDGPPGQDRQVKTDFIPLPVPVTDPQRIVVLGDTGCRITAEVPQDCSDPAAWPFARIAAEAAKLKPDLVIHVGDYFNRERACPDGFKGCEGSPFGDNWPAWDADFFAPAGALRTAAPWVIVRGNHEICRRAGHGFLRLLGPLAFDPAEPCSDHLLPYSIAFAALNLVVTDNSDASEQSVTETSVPAYRAEIAALAGEKLPSWWLQHRPVWGLISGPLGIPVGGNLTMIAALPPEGGIPAPVELMLSGHIHAFEAINYDPDAHVPPQLITGNGGDLLVAVPENLRGAIFQGSSGVHVKDGFSISGFGFVLMTRMEEGWRLDIYDRRGRIERQCVFGAGRIACPRRPR